MPIIRTHDVTLYGGDIVLRPLSDEHLPLLYKWCADPEILYWTEGGTDERNLSYGPETVRGIYGGVSQNALCFLVEVRGEAVGECWLQRMNLPEVLAAYPPELDVRRIDMTIGEKAWWNRGIGTRMIGMLIEYAFAGEGVDVLHCFCEDYNIRSRRVWEKNGFRFIQSEALPQPQKGRFQFHFQRTRQEFAGQRRVIVPPEKTFLLPVQALQPSQLYISEGKLALCGEWFDGEAAHMDAIPVKRLLGRILMTDGHTRAVMAHLAGCASVPCAWDEDELDMAAYAADVALCRAEGVTGIAALAARIVSAKDYEVLWRKRCMDLMNERLYAYLRQGEETLYWREQSPAPAGNFDIRALGADDLPAFNRHLALCGHEPLTADAWQGIAKEGTTYFCLFDGGEPVARAGIERYSEAFWALSDLRVIAARRGQGYGLAIAAFVTHEIIAAGRVATCRARGDNDPMRAILKRLGYQRLYA